MIRTVNDRDARVRVAEMLAESQSAKTATEHDHVNLFGLIHVLNVGERMKTSIARKRIPAGRTFKRPCL